MLSKVGAKRFNMVVPYCVFDDDVCTISLRVAIDVANSPASLLPYLVAYLVFIGKYVSKGVKTFVFQVFKNYSKGKFPFFFCRHCISTDRRRNGLRL